jgi:hypothetical protein
MGHDAGSSVEPPAMDAAVSMPMDAGATDSTYLWANWPMPNPVVSTLPNPQKYQIGAGGRVIDQVTHLEWQQTVDAMARDWKTAGEYCSVLKIDGMGGWRLPSRIELLSLVDYTIASPAIDPQSFSGAPGDSFWSSSPFIAAPNAAWGVNFGFKDGFVFTDDTKEHHRVRCVR